MKLKLFCLAGCALSALAAPALAANDEVAAAAAGSETTADAVVEADIAAADDAGEALVITGRRPIAESEAAALAVQRNSDSLVTVAASDSVGRLPDQNIAQAAGRLPGVAVQRDQGQARYISLRGAPINWTTLSIDGISIVSPEGRDTRYDSIPSAIASQIVVRKAVTPDMTGETVAGNVDVKTRSAFDYPGFHVAGKLGGGYVELGDRQEYEGQLVLSNRFDTGIGEIGMLVSGSYYQRDMVTDNFETDWEQVSQDRQPGNADRIWGRETENKLYRLTRKNYSYSGRLDWKPTEGHRIFLQSIFTAFTDDEARDNYIFDLDDRQSDLTRPASPACTVAPASSATNSGYADICIGNTPLKGSVYGIDINQRATLRAFEQSIFTNTLGGDHEFGADNEWALGWRLNYTRAKDDRSVVGEARYDSPSTRTARPTVAYDFTDPQLARVQLFRTLSSGGLFSAGAPVTAIDDFSRTLTSLTSSDFVDVTKAYTAKIDLSRQLPLFGGEGRITIGGQFDQRTKEANEAQLSITGAQAATLGIPTSFAPVSLDTPFKGEIPLGYTFRYFDIDAMRDNVKLADTIADYVPLLANFYNVREQIFAGYAMGRIGYDWGSVLGGVRVEHVKNRGRAFVTLGGASTPIEVENDYTLLFPSLHLNFDVAADKKLRLSFNSGAARPDYDQLRPNFTYDDANQTVSGGNPEAKPERAYGIDTYFEWYMQPQGYFMLGAFYKKVKDVLFDDTRTFGLDVLNSGGVDRSQYTFGTITNGGSGHIYGFEGAIQQQLEPYTEQLGLPSWLGGFGVSANVTLNWSKAETPDGGHVQLPGTSDVVFNIGGYYEKYGLSLRLNYQKRTEWLDALGADADGGNQFWASDDELDFSARYAVTPNFEVYVDASNLLNGAGRRYVRESFYSLEWERFGRRFTGGVRFNF
ncbi:TonB-dependent receptor [Sphingosinicella sp. BN140058]|uniref:TonB-dependent receptor n=1 Tax=Sphingosinicella sp. BN140058 TaxID=1892855 RepID=UPI0010101C5B|nr:TonB-dependent receptor [Sphingosinicella sp. BN140058]QAY75877.1 TonB-dependent receptor [Sphingosinicella sp. BN140058]